MKGLILKDLLHIKNNLKIILLTVVIYAIFFGGYNPNFLISFLTMTFGIQGLSTFSYDDQSGWDKYALSLPISRNNLVLSKYILLLTFPLVGAIFSSLLTLIICYVKGSLYSLQFEEFVYAGIASLAAIEAIFLILLPIIFKYGIERGRIIMMLLCFGVFGLLIAVGEFIPSATILNFLNPIIPVLPWILSLSLLLIAYVSYQISLRIVLKKEY